MEDEFIPLYHERAFVLGECVTHAYVMGCMDEAMYLTLYASRCKNSAELGITPSRSWYSNAVAMAIRVIEPQVLEAIGSKTLRVFDQETGQPAVTLFHPSSAALTPLERQAVSRRVLSNWMMHAVSPRAATEGLSVFLDGACLDPEFVGGPQIFADELAQWVAETTKAVVTETTAIDVPRPAVLPPRLTRVQVFRYLNEDLGFPIAFSTLETMATNGGGPPFQRWRGRPLYEVEDAKQWAEGQLSQKVSKTTTQANGGRPRKKK